MQPPSRVWVCLVFSLLPRAAAAAEEVNSIGIKLVRIPAGHFRMGNDAPTDPKTLRQFKLLTNGDYDERPVTTSKSRGTSTFGDRSRRTARDFDSTDRPIRRTPRRSWEEAVAF
jgi:formylglycine-generating enzyme required for sulfatase activity